MQTSMAVWLKAKVRVWGLGLRPRLNADRPCMWRAALLRQHMRHATCGAI